MAEEKTIRCAVIGYGGAFNMGKGHANWMNSTPGLKCVAICDIDPARTQAAQQDFPEVQTFNDVDTMLKEAEIDLVTIVTPHNTHAPLALKCLEAGKHVITEKPMCITVEEATQMIETAKRKGVMLSTFHNRRWDGDFMALRDVIRKGVIGEVFSIEAYGGGYGHPGYWWRSDKAISGGAMYDWGAHYIDWILNLIPQKMVNVTGFFYKLVWHDVTNEDHTEAIIRFANGAKAELQMSHISRVGKPRWRILGTKGAILDEGKGSFTVVTEVNGLTAQAEVKYYSSDWSAYYRNIAGHLRRGEELIVKPEEARRVIAVMQSAEKSSKTGQAEPVPYED